jgi:hypothetical protein
MPALRFLIGRLRSAERELTAQLAGIRAAISSLAEGARTRRSGRRRRKGTDKGIIIVGGKRGRKRSAAARAAMSRAQKARWAKARATKKRATRKRKG